MRPLFVIILSVVLNGCYQSESSLTDTLIYCSQNIPKTFNPQLSNDQATLDATTNQLFNRLVKIAPLTNEVISDLATHWLISENKKSYTFYLRRNVSFQQTDYFTPTRNFNADDVLFSFKRLIDKQSPFHTVNSQQNNYFFNHPFKNLIEDIIKIDDHTVKIVLNKPVTTFLPYLSAHYAVIHSQEYATKLLSTRQQQRIDFYPIGTGPYKLKNSNSSGIIRYSAHPQYWGKAPEIKNLIYDATNNNNKRYAKLLSGECDIMTNPAPSQLKVIRLNKSTKISSQATNNITLLTFNRARKNFSNKNIRQALSYAIDQKTIVDAVFFESATPANRLLMNESWAYDENTSTLRYDPQLALKLLKENNFNFNQTITMLIPTINSVLNPSFHKIAEFIQSNLEVIGVNIKIILLDNKDLKLRLAAGDYDTYLSATNMNINDPYSIFHTLLSCDVTVLEGNSSQWCGNRIQTLLDSALLAGNINLRKLYYFQLQQIIQQERPYYPIAHALRIEVFNNNIKGLQVDPLTGINFQNVTKIEAQ